MFTRISKIMLLIMLGSIAFVFPPYVDGGAGNGKFLFNAYRFSRETGTINYIFTYELSTHTETNVFESIDVPRDPVIAPDANTVAFNGYSGTFYYPMALFQLNPHSAISQTDTMGMLLQSSADGVRQVISGGYAWSPCINRDAMQLLFATNTDPHIRDIDKIRQLPEDSPTEIWIGIVPARIWTTDDQVVDKSGSFTRLSSRLALKILDSFKPLTLEISGSKESPAVASDCRTLAFFRRNPDNQAGEIWTMNIEDPQGSAQKLIDQADLVSLAWSPDSRYLAFIDTSDNQVYTYNLASKSLTRITSDRRGVQSAQWSPDGNHILVVMLDGGPGKEDDPTIAIMNPNGSNFQDLFRGSDPAWFP